MTTGKDRQVDISHPLAALEAMLERHQAANQTMMNKVLVALGGKPDTSSINQHQPVFTQTTIDMTVAHDRFKVNPLSSPLNYIQCFCDGSLKGVTLQTGDTGATPIDLSQFSTIPISGPLSDVYITNNVIDGRTTLVLYWVQSAAPLSLSSTFSPAFNVISKANLFNVQLPVANTNLLSVSLVPTLAPGIFRIYVVPSIAGILSLTRTVGGVTVTELLNGGVALVAGASYMFSVSVKDTTESINLQLSTPSLGASNLANGTGVANGAPITLVMGDNTIVATGAGSFTVTLGAGITGTATSGTATVTGSPQALAAGANTVTTGVTTGNFVINLTGGTMKKLQVDEAVS